MTTLNEAPDALQYRVPSQRVPVPPTAARGWTRLYSRAMVGLDLLAGLLAGLITLAVRTNLDGQTVGPVSYPVLVVTLPLAWVATQALAGAYTGRLSPAGNADIVKTFKAAVALTAVIGFTSYALHAQLARGFVIVALPTAMALSVLGRLGSHEYLRRARRGGRFQRLVLVVGPRDLVARIIQDVDQDSGHAIKVIGACLSNGIGQTKGGLPDGVPVLGSIHEAADIACRIGADAVAVASSEQTTGAMLRRLSWELESSGTELLIAPGLAEVAVPRLRVHPLGTLPLLHVGQPAFDGVRRVIKSVFDLLASALLLILFLPLMVVIAILIPIGSRGPIIFRQTRVGRDGREFTMYKFRTMIADAEARRSDLVDLNHRDDGLLFKIKEDPRVTPVGRRLRRYSMDELPQLVNVLLGQMSLVGPRPPLPQEASRYTDDVRRRLLVKPGLTGLWQVSGRSDLTWEHTVRLDLHYVDNWSLSFDLALLWRTIFAVLGKSGAY